VGLGFRKATCGPRPHCIPVQGCPPTQPCRRGEAQSCAVLRGRCRAKHVEAFGQDTGLPYQHPATARATPFFGRTTERASHHSVEAYCVKRHGAEMASGDQYRVKAVDMYTRAKDQTDPTTQAHFESLALSYLRLAEQADRRGTYEQPSHTQHPTQQQQPQGQQKPRRHESE
jgi:hypothetical protein